jgi:hypothetical protein
MARQLLVALIHQHPVAIRFSHVDRTGLGGGGSQAARSRCRHKAGIDAVLRRRTGCAVNRNGDIHTHAGSDILQLCHFLVHELLNIGFAGATMAASREQRYREKRHRHFDIRSH